MASTTPFGCQQNPSDAGHGAGCARLPAGAAQVNAQQQMLHAHADELNPGYNAMKKK
jgi:hypothetical protein